MTMRTFPTVTLFMEHSNARIEGRRLARRYRTPR